MIERCCGEGQKGKGYKASGRVYHGEENSRESKKDVAAKKDWDSYQWKVNVFKGKLEDSNTQLAQSLRVISARDRELEIFKDDLEEAEQKFYDEGFNDAEHSGRKVVFNSRWLGFPEGWMATVNAFDLPSSSPFRDPSQVPMPEDPIGAQVKETSVMEEENSLSMQELAEQIGAHTKVIDLENPIPPNSPEGFEARPTQFPQFSKKFSPSLPLLDKMLLLRYTLLFCIYIFLCYFMICLTVCLLFCKENNFLLFGLKFVECFKYFIVTFVFVWIYSIFYLCIISN